MIFIYVPCQNLDEAKTIGRTLIEKRMAGKVDLFPTHSIFRGRDGVQEREEVAMIIKTTDRNVQNIEDTVRERYKNRIPCVAAFMLYRINREFKEWLIASVS